jgi:CHAD domain-containing protein
VTYLDTFDWRIHQAGSRLTLESEGARQTLQWAPRRHERPYVLPVDGDGRFVRHLPDGFLRSQLEPILEVRALLPLGSTRVARRSGRLVDPEGNTTVHLWFESTVPLAEDGSPDGSPKTTVRIEQIPAIEHVYRSTVERLQSSGAVMDGHTDDLLDAAAARGRVPGDYTSKLRVVLTSDQRSDEALRAILADLLETLRANIDGVLADIDIEFLHDLRVATRRTRSALAQVKGVLPGPALERFRQEFKWLGEVTGPCRDLDVYLLELEGFRRQLGEREVVLDPLHRLIERSRNQAHRKVCVGLNSSRFRRLIDSWTEFLDAPVSREEEPPNAARSIGELSSERILKAYSKMFKQRSKFTDDPTPEALHALRIDGKKLRYLLEFFASLYPAATTKQLVKELKHLQDLLGGINDMEVQQRWLRDFAGQLMDSDDAEPETLLAMGELAAAMKRRQSELQGGFASAFASFSSHDSHQLYLEQFGRE